MFWNWKKTIHLEEPTERLDAFLRMLRTRQSGIPAPQPANPPYWARLNALLDTQAADATWNDAYEAEELLDQLAPAGVLPALFLSREADARALTAEVVKRRRDQFDAAKAPEEQRIALLALDEDLHEHWAEQDERLQYQSRITHNTAVLMVTSGVALVASFFAVRGHLEGSAEPLRPSLTSLRLVLVVLCSGLFGACLSMLIGLRDRIEAASMAGLEKMALKVNHSARAAVGAAGALVLFAMALGGLLDGKLVPRLTETSLSFSNLAHLVVICTLAGFSEKLVPSALNKLDPQAPKP